MAKPRPLSGLVVVLLVLGICLAGVHSCYPLPYVYRVLAYRDSDFSDIHRFPARSIAPAGSPSALTIALDPRSAKVVEEHPDVAELGTFLEATETSVFLVVHQGRLVMERYLRGHDRSSLQNTFSVSKSVASALVGLAVRDEAVALDASIVRYLPELGERDEAFAEISVEHLLDMRSGIRYASETPFPFVTADDPLIYYHPDLRSVVLDRTAIASPPGTFQYNNYNPPMLGLILLRATGMSVAAYLERELWRPLGAEGAAGWTVDDRGFERMESGFHARARDLARFGLLYLRGGLAAGRRILPEDWIRFSTNLSEPPELDRFDGRSWRYKAGWWIVPRPEGSADYCAIGRYGQFIYVSPQYDVVFVRNGPGRRSVWEPPIRTNDKTVTSVRPGSPWSRYGSTIRSVLPFPPVPQTLELRGVPNLRVRPTEGVLAAWLAVRSVLGRGVSSA